MNIRDYWILKLSVVRKQSPYTGKLIENLLTNDSKVSREVLAEIAKLYNNKQHSKKLQEAGTKENTIKELKEQLLMVSYAISMIRMGEPGANYKLYSTYIDEQNRLIEEIKRLNEHAKENTNKTADKEPNDKEVGFFKKVLEKLEELYNTAKLKDVWNKVKGLVNSKTKIAIAVSIIILALIAGVYIQKKYGSVGKSILTVIISVSVLGLFSTGVFDLHKFFTDIYNMIIHFIETIKNKFRKNTTVQGEQQ